METRIEREKNYHNMRFAKEIREPTTKYYKITSKIREHFNNEVFKNCDNSRILELGCSKGRFSIELAQKNAIITGIDISEVAIEKAKENAKEKRVENKCTFLVKDASKLDFQNNSFDKVVGGAILHHLDYEKALLSISKVLNTNGEGIFLEPLGFNPLINLYRKLTPKFRTVDEKPLKKEELNILYKYFDKVEITPYYFTTILAVPFIKLNSFEKIVAILDNFDKLLFKIPYLRKFAWQIIIKISNPKNKYS